MNNKRLILKKSITHNVIKCLMAIVFILFSSLQLNAQTQLELANASYPAASLGLTTANQTASLLENTTGSSFATFSPTVTVTASISNQQYNNIATSRVSTGKGINFGGRVNSIIPVAVQMPVYNSLNTVDNPINSLYTSNPKGPNSTGISVIDNYGFYFYNSVDELFATNTPTNGRYYFGDITFTFNQPVSNPVLHINGLGSNVLFGNANKQGITTELELQTAGVVLSKLSGSSELTVASNNILNNAATPTFNCGAGAACGSVKVAGTNITTLTFKVYVRGDGNGTAWSHTAITAGDEFMISVSMNSTVDVSGNVFVDANGLSDNTVNGTGTNVGNTLYANLVDTSGKVVAAVAVAANGTYIFNGISAGNYTIVLSTTQGVQGAVAPAPSLPTNYVNTGENLGIAAGNDGTVNGILPITVATTSISNANFGIYLCPNIIPTITASGVTTACFGAGLTLTSTAATSYQWFKDGVAVAGANSQNYTPSSSGTYTMVVFTGGGICSTTSNAIPITINYAAQPVVTAQSSTSICATDSVRLSSSSGYSNYQWYKNGVLISGANNLDYYATTAGIYSVIVSNGAGCFSDTSNKITVVINATPTAPIIAAAGSSTICNGNGITLTSNAAIGNQWYLNGAAIFMATNQTFTATIPGTYTVKIGNGACQSIASNAVIVTGAAIAGFSINKNYQEQCDTVNNSFVFTSNVPTANKTYSWSFGDTSFATTINAIHHYNYLGTYTVKQIVKDTITGCIDSTTQTITVAGCGVTSGGGGGVETKPLGDIIAIRLYGNAINSKQPEIDYSKAAHFVNNSGTVINGNEKIKLANIIPTTTANTNNSYISTPVDLLGFTNAIDILSIDYTVNNNCKAVALGTQTIGTVYGHTKPICDRLKDAKLLEVKKISVAGYDVIASKLQQRNGLQEFCINFSVGFSKNSSLLSLQSNWLTDNYEAQDTMFNFQVWSTSYTMSATLAEQMITKLKTYKPIIANANNTNDLPKAFIESVKREKNILEITITNPTNSTTGNIELIEKVNEFANTNNKTIALNIAANTTSIIKLNVEDAYENNIYMHLDSNNADMVYMTDGGWSADYDKATTTLNKFTTTNSAISINNNEYPLFRKVQVAATTKNYVSAYKLVKGGGIERDFTKYKTLKLNATATGTSALKITLIKKGITNWNNQYTYTLPVNETASDYAIVLSQFKSKASNQPINANDITAISFTWENPRATNANISGSLANIRFAMQDVAVAQIVNENEINIYPNPNMGKFKIGFSSNDAKPLAIKLIDIYTGKTIYNQYITCKKGVNNIDIVVKDFFTSNIYMLTIEGDGIKYSPKKVMLQSIK
jgi:PKD domain